MYTTNIISLLFTFLLPTTQAQCPSISTVQQDLQGQLSSGSSITGGSEAPERWSEYGAPRANIVVNVGSEEDVATTVKYCNSLNLPFVAQNGGNGWADTFNLGDCGVIINIARLNQITFGQDKTSARIQGGVNTQSLIDAAYGNDTRIATPNCPCLGFLGSALGGGVNRLSGQYGWSVDQVESVTVVLASGETVQASNVTNTDLFWSVNGAAPNFGIVTSATIRTYPIPMDDNVGWQGPIIYPENKLEELVTAINNLTLTSQMAVDLLLITTGPPDYSPAIILQPLYMGSESSAREAFASLLSIDHIQDNTTMIPYNEWSNFAIPFCTPGGRKPAYGMSGFRVDPTAFRQVYQEFKSFVSMHGAAVANTSILVEYYPTIKALDIGWVDSSYPYRDLPCHSVAVPWYNDSSLDEVANTWGAKVRDLLRLNNGLADGFNATYINFAHGDEPLATIYGQSLPRLQDIKRQYDPDNRFNQWFPLL